MMVVMAPPTAGSATDYTGRNAACHSLIVTLNDPGYSQLGLKLDLAHRFQQTNASEHTSIATQPRMQTLIPVHARTSPPRAGSSAASGRLPQSPPSDGHLFPPPPPSRCSSPLVYPRAALVALPALAVGRFGHPVGTAVRAAYIVAISTRANHHPTSGNRLSTPLCPMPAYIRNTGCPAAFRFRWLGQPTVPVRCR